MVYYKLIKVIINIPKLANIIFNKFIRHNRILEFFVNDQNLIYFKVLILFLIICLILSTSFLTFSTSKLMRNQVSK